jgi:NADP-dependent 3-hydroxy acid dehydrogenase YdfG
VVEALADSGASLHLLARTADALAELADRVGGRAWPADLTDEAETWAALDRLQEESGGAPDVVVNAAGVFDVAPLADTTLNDFDRNLAVNLRGTFIVVRTLLPAMLARGSGLFVNVGSVAGRKTFPGNGAYSASKWGLRGLHGVLLEEIRGTGVRATLVEPAATDTSIWDRLDPDGREDLPGRADMLSPDQVAAAIVFAATRPPEVALPYLPVERA